MLKYWNKSHAYRSSVSASLCFGFAESAFPYGGCVSVQPVRTSRADAVRHFSIGRRAPSLYGFRRDRASLEPFGQYIAPDPVAAGCTRWRCSIFTLPAKLLCGRGYLHESGVCDTAAFDACLLWGKTSRKLSVYRLPGNHRGLVKEGPEPLAALLSLCIQAASKTGADAAVAQ
jgi:hypothetical protein